MDNTDKLLDDLFEKARTAESKTPFELTQKKFLASTKLGVKANFLTLKNGLIMLATITTIGLSLLYMTSSDGEKTLTKKINKSDLITINKEEIYKTNSKTIDSDLKRNDAPITFVATKSFDTKNIISEKRQKVLSYNGNQGIQTTNTKNQSFKIDDSFKFPKLTTEEIKENNKQKSKMLKQLTKFDKKKYAYIPSGTTEENGKEVSLQAFYMQTSEVSVLEYRTFLYDLIILKRKEDFLIAKPDQTQWTKIGGWLKPMQDNYFTHPAYDEYPINNISREAALLYCKWITEEHNKVHRKRINDARIPTTTEWIYAASGNGKNFPYPWGGPYVRNAKGCYLANFKPGIDSAEACSDEWNKLKDIKKSDSLYNYKQTLDDVKLPKSNRNSYSADGGYFTVKVSSYNPNQFGLYCMSGNVAEMTINNDETPICKGGSWRSESKDIQINSKDLFKNITTPNVEIGFRPVFTFLDPKKPLIGVMGKTTSAVPPGTVQITNNLYFDATEITNFNWKEYLNWQTKIYGKTSKEYKKALPDTTVWDELNKAYTTHYYSHPAYNNYPVVGISYEQAVAYCKWRTDRVKQLFKPSDAKDFIYRLPTKAEWEKVANAGYSSINAKKDGDKHKFNLKKSKADLEGVAGKLNDNADVTAPIESYWPNNYGIYNIIGNVAEMIQEKGVAKGGSWKHTAEQSNLTKQISYTKPTSWLGFRCVCEIID